MARSQMRDRGEVPVPQPAAEVSPMPSIPAPVSPPPVVGSVAFHTADPMPLGAGLPLTLDHPPLPRPRAPLQAKPNQLALQDMLAELLNAQVSDGQKFYIVVIPEAAHPRVETFATVQLQRDRLIELLNQENYVLPFMGNYLPVTKGPHRFLKTPMGMLPLFGIPDANKVEEEEFGWVGPGPLEPIGEQAVPQDIVPPSPAHVQEASPLLPAAPPVEDTPVFDS